MCSIPQVELAAGGDFGCAQAGCRACQDALVREHTGLIHVMVRQVEHAGVPYAELIQAGRLALWRAVLHFDATRGVRFSTYGCVAIQRALWDAVREARCPQVTCPPHQTPEVWTWRSQQPEIQQALRTAVAQLPQRLGAVLRVIYGLDGQPPRTRAAVGRAWGLSRERIRQLHDQVLTLLRQPGYSAPLYQLCERDTRTAYLQAMQTHRAWHRRQRR